MNKKTIKDKDKIFLIWYLNVSGLSREDTLDVIDQTTKEMANYDETIIGTVVPIYQGDNKVECINPRLIDEVEYEKIKKQIDNIKAKYTDFINYEFEMHERELYATDP